LWISPEAPATDHHEEQDMTITSTTLTRASGVAAAVAGLLFIGVQISHPTLDAEFATTTEYMLRESVKILMAVLSLIGITGMYLRQVTQSGVLGLLGYLVFGAGYLVLLSIQIIGVFVLPFLATTSPDYVSDVLAAAVAPTDGDIGPMKLLFQLSGITFLAGGFLFGIALFRARVLARWAAALLAGAAIATVATSLIPQLNPRLFAIPVGVAMIGLGYSLWRRSGNAQRTELSSAVSPLDPAGAK
jgi:hypothetical protein